MRVLVTGAAGFIGFHLSKRLLDEDCQVFGIDNLNHYYDTNLKKARLAQLPRTSRFIFDQLDLADGANLRRLVEDFEPEVVVNLAAQKFAPLCVCLVQFRLWSQPQGALLRG